MHRFLVIYEENKSNFSAYCPDLLGCVATGETLSQCENNMAEAIQIHVQGLIEDKKRVPKSKSRAEFIAICG